jgi:type VI secretion system protein ImpL
MDLVQQALKDDWVMERPAAKNSDLVRLYEDLQKLYFAEYERRWHGLLQNLQINSPRSITETIAKLDLLTGSDTPLLPLLQAVAHNTDMVAAGADKGSAAAAQFQASSQVRQAWLGQTGEHHLERLARRFQPLNRLVEPVGKMEPPITGIMSQLNEIRDVLIQITNGASTEDQALQLARQRMGQPGTADVISRANLTFRRLPAPVNNWLLTLSSSGWQLMMDTAKAKLNAIWRQDVVSAYREAVKGRYPVFTDSPTAMTIADFSRFFAPQGIMDSFFEKHLKPFVDTSRSRWRLFSGNSSHINLSPQVLRQFQYAAKIRDAFFPNGGRRLAINFTLRPSELDKAIDTFSIFIGNQQAKYRHGPRLASSFVWPGSRPVEGVRLVFRRLDDQQEISKQYAGPWGFFRVLDRANLTKTPLKDRFQLTFQVEGYAADYELQAPSVINPFALPELHKFRCPDSL